MTRTMLTPPVALDVARYGDRAGPIRRILAGFMWSRAVGRGLRVAVLSGARFDDEAVSRILRRADARHAGRV